MQGQPGGFNRMGGMGGRGRGGRGQPRPLAPGSDRIINVPKASIRVVTSIAGMDLANKIVRSCLALDTLHLITNHLSYYIVFSTYCLIVYKTT